MPTPTGKAMSTGKVLTPPTAPPRSCEAAEGEPPRLALTLSTTRTYSSSMSETYTSAFAGVGTARHRSCTMTVDRPGRRGRTCKQTWAQPWLLPAAPHPRQPTATQRPRAGASQAWMRGFLTHRLACPAFIMSPLPAGVSCRRAGLGLRKQEFQLCAFYKAEET